MPRTLLVVDDSATMRKVFEITFAGEDLTVFAHDGSASLMEQARAQQPAAAVVDINLGGADAYAIVRALKSDAALGNLPVLLLYSEHSPVDEGRAREVGAEGTLQKPFDTQAAIDRVKQLLSGARAPAPAAGVAPRAPASPVPAPGAAVGSARPVAPSAAGVGSIGARQPVAGGAKATQMFVSPPSAIPQPPQMPPPSPPMPAPRPVAPPPVVAAPQPRAFVPQPASVPQPGPPRRDSVELEMDLGGAEDVSLEPSAPAPAQARTPAPATSGPAAGITAEVAQRVAAMGLSASQVDAVTALTREVVERVVWEVVPQLAETLIREEIKRLTAE